LFKAFNLQLDKIEEDCTNSDGEYLNIMRDQRKLITDKINQFRRPDGYFDGTMMRSGWFPNIPGEIDVFISHSHNDEKAAIALASFLYDEFRLVSFIDSLVWNNSAKLLKLIDDEFCKNDDRETYDYTLRNQSTSHVYMMLTVALAEMIDRCECLFFLNTPESITPYDSVQEGTVSPWIFSELSMSKLVRNKLPHEHRPIDNWMKKAFESRDDSAYAMILHKLPTEHLIRLTGEDIRLWSRMFDGKQVHALDILYEVKRIHNG
jgi:hypothetical protein